MIITDIEPSNPQNAPDNDDDDGLGLTLFMIVDVIIAVLLGIAYFKLPPGGYRTAIGGLFFFHVVVYAILLLFALYSLIRKLVNGLIKQD